MADDPGPSTSQITREYCNSSKNGEIKMDKDNYFQSYEDPEVIFLY